MIYMVLQLTWYRCSGACKILQKQYEVELWTGISHHKTHIRSVDHNDENNERSTWLLIGLTTWALGVSMVNDVWSRKILPSLTPLSNQVSVIAMISGNIRLQLKLLVHNTSSIKWYINAIRERARIWDCICICMCLLITLTRSPKVELGRVQLNGISQMHMKGASGCRRMVMNEPGAQQPSQMFLTWIKGRPQHRKFCALLLRNSVWVL